MPPDASVKPGFSATGGRTVTIADAARLPTEESEGINVAITVPVPAADAVKTPELVIVPAVLGFTDHTTETP